MDKQVVQAFTLPSVNDSRTAEPVDPKLSKKKLLTEWTELSIFIIYV